MFLASSYYFRVANVTGKSPTSYGDVTDFPVILTCQDCWHVVNWTATFRVQLMELGKGRDMTSGLLDNAVAS